MVPKRPGQWLAATDGSDTSEHAAAVVRGLLPVSGAKLELFSVETVGLPALAGIGVGGRVTREGSSPEVRWGTGIPGFEIVHRAARTGAELIILGRDARSPQNPLPLGRTADTVVRRHDGPCLLIPPGVERLDRMVLALDGTQRGLSILGPAAVLAGAFRAQCFPLHVCRCDPPSMALASCLVEPAVERIREALAGYPGLADPSELVVRQGAPVWETLEFVQQSHANLLVLGVRRGGPRGEMGSGHVGQDLLRTAPVAILTIPI